MKLDPRLRRAKEAEKEAKRREEQRKAEELRREQEERERQAEEQRIRQVSSGVSAMKKRLRRQRQHQCSLVVVFPGARGAGAGRHVGYVEGWVGWNVFGYVADY